MKKQSCWVYELLKRLNDMNYVEENDISLFNRFFSIKTSVSLDEIDEAFLYLKGFQYSRIDVERELWKQRNIVSHRKNGAKFTAIDALFEKQLDFKPYCNYKKSYLMKLQLAAIVIIKLIEKRYYCVN